MYLFYLPERETYPLVFVRLWGEIVVHVVHVEGPHTSWNSWKVCTLKKKFPWLEKSCFEKRLEHDLDWLICSLGGGYLRFILQKM
jgi:hypothetical protein